METLTLQTMSDRSVEALLDMSFAKYRSMMGRELDPEGTSSYIFKVRLQTQPTHAPSPLSLSLPLSHVRVTHNWMYQWQTTVGARHVGLSPTSSAGPATVTKPPFGRPTEPQARHLNALECVSVCFGCAARYMHIVECIRSRHTIALSLVKLTPAQQEQVSALRAVMAAPDRK